MAAFPATSEAVCLPTGRHYSIRRPFQIDDSNTITAVARFDRQLFNQLLALVSLQRGVGCCGMAGCAAPEQHCIAPSLG
jgi:hypothetical protein